MRKQQLATYVLAALGLLGLAYLVEHAPPPSGPTRQPRLAQVFGGCATCPTCPTCPSTLDQGSFLLQEISCATRDLTLGSGQVTVVNVTEDGLLHGLQLEVTTNVTGGASVDIDVTMAGTKRDLNVYSAANTWDSWITDAQVASDTPALVNGEATATGATAGEFFMLQLNANYTTSLLVEIDQNGSFTAGDLRVCAMRSTKL